MKRHLHCEGANSGMQQTMELQHSCLIAATHETSLTLCGAISAMQNNKVRHSCFSRDTWNIRYNAQSNRSGPPTSPNIVPATKKDSYDWSLSHLKHHLQCPEQQESSYNNIKYCACHPSMNREWSEHETVSPQPASQPRLLFAQHFLLKKKQHFALRLSL